MITNWTNLYGTAYGDIAYTIRQKTVSSDFIDFEIMATSSKWNNFSLEFLFRNDDNQEWQKPILTCFGATKSLQNMVFGIPCSQQGIKTIIRWHFKANNVITAYSQTIKTKIIPTIRTFSKHYLGWSNSEISDFNIIKNEVSTQQVYTKTKDGNYIVYSGNIFYVKKNVQDNAYFSKDGFNQISHIFQKNDGNYIVSDSTSVKEIDHESGSVTKSLSISGVAFFEYCEETENILLTLKNTNEIKEYSWNNTYGYLIWELPIYSLVSPTSASYNDTNKQKIAICDYGNNRIVLYDRNYGTTTYISGLSTYSNNEYDVKIKYPFRVFWKNSNIYLVEHSGKLIDFASMDSEAGIGYAGIEVDFEVA